MKFSFFTSLLLYWLLVYDGECAMSEAQVKAALKLLRNVCQPKSEVTNEEIDAMHNGNWDLGKNAQCYMHCVLKMYKLQKKDNTFDWEGGLKTLETQAPPSLAETAAKSVVNCKDAVKTVDDKCAAGFEIARCIYFDDPEHYFLP